MTPSKIFSGALFRCSYPCIRGPLGFNKLSSSVHFGYCILILAEFLEPKRSYYTWIRAPEKSTPPYALLVILEGVIEYNHTYFLDF
jgi:hypothetical protein